MAVAGHGCHVAPSEGLSQGGSQPHACQAPVGQEASGVLATRYVFSRSVCRLGRGDACGVALGAPHVGLHHHSPRVVHDHAAAARVTPGTRGVVVFQEAGESYRSHQALPLSLQPDESCGVKRALHGVHYLWVLCIAGRSSSPVFSPQHCPGKGTGYPAPSPQIRT